MGFWFSSLVISGVHLEWILDEKIGEPDHIQESIEFGCGCVALRYEGEDTGIVEVCSKRHRGRGHLGVTEVKVA